MSTLINYMQSNNIPTQEICSQNYYAQLVWQQPREHGVFQNDNG